MVSWARRGSWCLLFAVAAGLVVPLASGANLGGSEKSDRVLLAFLLVIASALIAVTGPRSPISGSTVGTATVGGVVAGLGLFAALPFERIGSPLASRTPGGLGWLLVTAAVLAVPAWALVRAEHHESGQGSYAFFHLSAVALVVVFATAVLAVRFFPGSIPDIVPVSVVWQGDGPAKALQYSRENSAIEAIDPYVLPLMLGTFLFAVIGVVATVMRRPRSLQPV